MTKDERTRRALEALTAAGLEPDPTGTNTLANPADPDMHTWTDPYSGETLLSAELCDKLRDAVRGDQPTQR